MSVFKCKMCGGTLNVDESQTVGVCEYCGTKQTLPKLSDEKRLSLYDSANDFRRNNQFDEAYELYEQILMEDNTDAEDYWSLVLCTYGIVYVEDKDTNKRIPTVNKAQNISVFADVNFKNAVKYADSYQKEIYEQEAKRIDAIQKHIQEIASSEDSYDVFLCYKESENGKRTIDSVIANDIYYELTNEGIKVFFSKITLENKLGSEYEPYIFSALNSAKVMVVIGTKAEYFFSPWVKNEWSRFLSLMNEDKNKILIPAYKDMDPYDLPKEFSNLQALNMGNIGFIQDLIRGIKKVVLKEEDKEETKTIIINENANPESLLKRAYLFIEDRNFTEADEYCERVLDMEPENASAYVAKMLCELKVNSKEQLASLEDSFENNDNYLKAVRFEDDKLKKELSSYINKINENKIEKKYNKLNLDMKNASTKDEFINLSNAFASLGDYKDSELLKDECLRKADEVHYINIYKEGIMLKEQNTLDSLNKAIQKFQSISNWNDSLQQIEECKNNINLINKKNEDDFLQTQRIKAKSRKKRRKTFFIVLPIIIVFVIVCVVLNSVVFPLNDYNSAIEKIQNGNYEEGWAKLEELGDYKDSAKVLKESKYNVASKMEKEKNYAKAAMLYGYAVGYKDAKEKSMECWGKVDSIKSTISAGDDYSVAVKEDGSVVACGSNNKGQCDVENWKNIIAVCANDEHTLGLKMDGTVVSVGKSKYDKCDVEDWNNIISISSGYRHSVGLKADGTVVAVGDNKYGQCDVEDWKDIVFITAFGYKTVGIKSDGSVVVSGKYNLYYATSWENIVDVSLYRDHIIGLKKDGSVVAEGNNDKGQGDVDNWKNILVW